MSRSDRPKLLTGAQRRVLLNRVRTHANKLENDIWRLVKVGREPEAVRKARQVVARYEEAQRRKRDRIYSDVRREMQQITDNLVFDDVESCIRQVEEFEQRKAPNNKK